MYIIWLVDDVPSSQLLATIYINFLMTVLTAMSFMTFNSALVATVTAVYPTNGLGYPLIYLLFPFFHSFLLLSQQLIIVAHLLITWPLTLLGFHSKILIEWRCPPPSHSTLIHTFSHLHPHPCAWIDMVDNIFENSSK